MASFVHRAFVYLGLVDDEIDDYEIQQDPDVEARPSIRNLGPPSAPTAVVSGPGPASEPEAPQSGVRTLTREEQHTSGVTMVTPKPAVVRPISPERSAKVHVVAPTQFADAQEIGDRLKASQPVIVNLQAADRELGRRMIDFCSGVTYALAGTMEKVADQVFLLTPSNVEVSEEERQRLQERGLYRS